MQSNDVKIKISEDLYYTLIDSGVLTSESLQEVVTSDDFLKDDEMYQKLKKESIKAYKNMQDYKFKKLHNIK
jgi:uncharacterized iron-regulated protein